MKFRISRASNYNPDASPCPGAVEADGEWWVELATLDDLLAFVAEQGQVVVDNQSPREIEKGVGWVRRRGPSIQIYDGYIE